MKEGTERAGISATVSNFLECPLALDGIKVSKKKRYLPNGEDDGRSRYIEYLDLALCFDCETYSFTVATSKGIEKRATMWAWGISVEQTCYIGRTWGEFLDMLECMRRAWGLREDRRVIIYVHNLSYDFQFFRRWFHWDNVFALSSREVCYCSTSDGIEFRCSYILTGYSLAKVGEHLTQHTIRKLVGEIDYTIARHSKTPLTQSEVDYLVHDCLVVSAHIREQIDLEGSIVKIPLTKTGYVRRYIQRACFRNPNVPVHLDYSRLRYYPFIHALYLDKFIYETLRRAFQGGYTHANPFYVGLTMENVVSFDFASAYPAVLCSELFPVTPPERIAVNTIEDFITCLMHYCCIFTIELHNLKPKRNFDHYLSKSHCIIPSESKVQISNGRIVSCDYLITTITNVDFDIIDRCYDYDDLEFPRDVYGMVRYGMGFMPKPIVEATLHFFEEKTKLKGKKGMEQEYMSAKEMLNSIYGMFVQNPLRPRIPYNLEENQWGELDEETGRVYLEVALKDEEILEALEAYNDKMTRATYYAWGVFITAYCRRNLWRGILEFGDDYVYSDTDSIKGMHPERHMEFIKSYNEEIQRKIKGCLKYLRIDPDRSTAWTTGDHPEEKALGVWEHDGTYTRFKSLGAKRYMTEQRDPKTGELTVSLTVSGINKKEAIPYLKQKALDEGRDIFDLFCDTMDIPPGYAGKMIPYFGDKEISGCVRDYLGNVADYHEMSYVYMEPGGYTLKLAPQYVAYLDMLRKVKS